MNPSRLLSSAVLLSLSLSAIAAEPNPLGSGYHAKNTPEVILADPRVHLSFTDEKLVLEDGLQPSLIVTKTGALVVQAQISASSIPNKRFGSHWAMRTIVSRDDGETWIPFPLPAGENGLNLEAGGIQLRDGSLYALDSYVLPGDKPGMGRGQFYFSTDDWRTLQGPVDFDVSLPGANFYGSTGDNGTAHPSLRLHRRILELPNGDLLTTLYGWFDGDTVPVEYMPTMHKSRVVLLRSKDHGRRWDMVSVVATGSTFGTEGVGEAVITRMSAGAHAGRLICQMRTGRELRESISDDEGKTWSPAQPRVYADLDVYRTEKWIEMFRGVKDKKGNLIENNPVELIGAVVDPDLVELRSGVLVATFGVRVPPRACWPRAEHPSNGSYLAVSLDQGATWSHVVRLTSGVLTTHYTAVQETLKDNRVYVLNDLGDWRSGRGRSTHGRFVQVKVDPK